MDVTELITAAPNLAFGLVCLWFVQQIQKERALEAGRYATSLEKINELYIQLLEKAIMAITTNASISTANGDLLNRILTELAAIRSDLGGLRDRIERLGEHRAGWDSRDRRNE